MGITRRELFALCAAAPVMARTRSSVAITMDDVDWQLIPEDRRKNAEESLLSHLQKTRVFLFAVGQHVDNSHGTGILVRWGAEGHLIGNHTYSHKALIGQSGPAEFEHDVLRNDALLK